MVYTHPHRHASSQSDLVCSTGSSTLACSVIFHINRIIAFFHIYGYMTDSKYSIPGSHIMNFAVYIVDTRVTCSLPFVVDDAPLVLLRWSNGGGED